VEMFDTWRGKRKPLNFSALRLCPSAVHKDMNRMPAARAIGIAIFRETG
jgi:hypothetical protein